MAVTTDPDRGVPYLRLFGGLLRGIVAGVAGARSLRHLAALALFLPPFLALQLVHWLGFLLDEIFFRRYREVVVREPLFVVGLPRTGTTFLQQVLAADENRFTTLRLAELLLAPSVTERRLWQGAASVDRSVGSPFARLIRRLETRCLGWMENVHAVSMENPEEDYLFLLPVFRCFLLVLPFPDSRPLWGMSRFDALPERERRAVLAFYRSCLQRHLYATGSEKHILSKNPSFTPMLASLIEAFPDARVLCTSRDPADSVPSLLSSLEPGARFFGWSTRAPEDRDRLLTMLEHYAGHSTDLLERLGETRCARVPLSRLSQNAEATILDVYRRFGWTPDPRFVEALGRATRRGRRHRGAHTYALEDFGLTREDLAERFHGVRRCAS